MLHMQRKRIKIQDNIMEKLDSLIKKVKSFKASLNEAIGEALQLHESEILALNTNEQLYNRGITTTGNSIVPEYATSTVRYKHKKNQPTDLS